MLSASVRPDSRCVRGSRRPPSSRRCRSDRCRRPGLMSGDGQAASDRFMQAPGDAVANQQLATARQGSTDEHWGPVAP